MIQIPNHLEDEFNLLTPKQKQKFLELAMWGAAGGPGNVIISDMAFANCMRMVNNMGLEPTEPIPADKTLNPDWDNNSKK